jgi:hypothetical protein
MIVLEVLTWMLMGAVLSMTLPGPRWTKLMAAEIGALVGGFAGRSLDWQALLGSYSVSALIIAGIGAIMALEIGLVVSRKSW